MAAAYPWLESDSPFIDVKIYAPTKPGVRAGIDRVGRYRLEVYYQDADALKTETAYLTKAGADALVTLLVEHGFTERDYRHASHFRRGALA